MADTTTRPLAVVTGASTGIGLEIARELAGAGHDLVVVADEPAIAGAARILRTTGVDVQPVELDLSTAAGVDALVSEVADRCVDVLVANAGTAVSGAFVDSELDDHLALIGLNVTGVVHLTHRLLGAMVRRGHGRLLFTSSIVASMPGPYQSTYNASKAFLHLFAEALRTELTDSGVTVTSLLPGATDTEFFVRADMEDTAIADLAHDDPADVARAAVRALLDGDDQVVPGLLNKVATTASEVLPDRLVSAAHAKVAKPGSGRSSS